ANVYRPAADARPLVRLSLRAGSGQADGLAVYAEAGATPGYDAQYDAGKLVNSTGLNLASLSAANEPLAIDGRPAFAPGTVVPLTVGVPAAGTYTLVAVTLNNLPTGLAAYLTDAKTGQTTQLSAQAAYRFSVSATEATALLTGRFTLRFGPVTALAAISAALATEVTIYPNPAHGSFAVQLPAIVGASQVQAQLLNALGQVVRQHSAALPAAGTTFTVETDGLATGVYTLRLQAGTTTLAKRVIIK
ncbi:MAG: T9SS type A sorting domain-containing protein, partial [Hymenobacter sp.]